ncbi:VOC family protein [Taibaiella chishuiensis]|nr:VOC family protein [Taibaiella chishuiensis]
MNPANPVLFFEIPVSDLDRAEHFYQQVFGYDFERETIDGYEMSFFPFNDCANGISGALAKGDVYQPTRDGVIVYFRTEQLDQTLENVVAQNGRILYPSTFNEKYKFWVAEFEDSEGNRIAVQQLSAD